MFFIFGQKKKPTVDPPMPVVAPAEREDRTTPPPSVTVACPGKPDGSTCAGTLEKTDRLDRFHHRQVFRCGECRTNYTYHSKDLLGRPIPGWRWTIS